MAAQVPFLRRVSWTAVIAVTLFGLGIAHAQPSLTQTRTELVGNWLATVDGDARPRTLRITSVQQKSDSAFTLEAVFGYSDIKQAEADAEISQTATARKLALTAKSGVRVQAIQTSNGTFSGTFHFTDGTTKPISLTKLSADELRTKVDAALKGPVLLVYWSSKDCTWCTYWESSWSGMEHSLKSSEEFKKLTYRVVKSERLADPYADEHFASDIKWIKERIDRGDEKHLGRPGWGFYVNKIRVATFYGSKNWDTKILPEIKLLVAKHSTEAQPIIPRDAPR